MRSNNLSSFKFSTIAIVFLIFFQTFSLQAQTFDLLTFAGKDSADPASLTVSAPTFFKGLPSTFTVPLTTGDIASEGIIAYQFNILYDPSVIDPVGTNFGCSTVGTTTGNAGLSAACNVLPDGTLRVSVSGAGTISGAGTLLNLTFKTDDFAVAGSSSPLAFEDVFFFNNNGVVAASFVNGNITLVGPTASNAAISGKIIDYAGQPISNARITATDSRGFSRAARSNQFGFYQITDLPVGSVYIIKVSAKQFVFTSRVVNFIDELANFDLAAEPDKDL